MKYRVCTSIQLMLIVNSTYKACTYQDQLMSTRSLHRIGCHKFTFHSVKLILMVMLMITTLLCTTGEPNFPGMAYPQLK